MNTPTTPVINEHNAVIMAIRIVKLFCFLKMHKLKLCCNSRLALLYPSCILISSTGISSCLCFSLRVFR